ncbi:proline-rich protein 15-like [Triplophysa dalaica]|uniref:proline-rich protein 15-like n=1 Tax=Triplophysa dalaica TaxID=1582913 RepID=UPI0024DFB8D9|nr:proline-rich protein 15-like [Triplophysa dalaica]
MADRNHWWKTLTGRNKNIHKETQQELATSDNKSVKQPSTDIKNNNMIGDETYDDSQMEPSFNEHTSRRNLTVSRSGRCKEKRNNTRVRVTLPENNLYERTVAVAK